MKGDGDSSSVDVSILAVATSTTTKLESIAEKGADDLACGEIAEARIENGHG